MDGKLQFHEQGEANEFCFINEGKKWLIAFRMNGEKTVFDQREILRRLVACWNACEGIPTEHLELLVEGGQGVSVSFGSILAAEMAKGQCGKINGGHACTMPAGHKCPDCGLSLHDVQEGA